MISKIVGQIEAARRDAGYTQAELGRVAGLSRMTIQRAEAGDIDPRLSTVHELARALGMELILVPKILHGEVDDFLRSGGRVLGQPAGTGAPLSVIDVILAETGGNGKKS